MCSAGEKLDRRFLQSYVTKNFHTLRILSGLSTSELANRTGTTRQTINSLENGKTEKMNGTLLISMRAVLTEVANNNKDNNFCLALLNHILSLLFDYKYPTGFSVRKYEWMCISDAFFAVAKLSEAGFSEEKLEKLSEIILQAELDTDFKFGIIDETTGESQLSSIYQHIGLPTFFSERKKVRAEFHEMLFKTANDKFKERGDF